MGSRIDGVSIALTKRRESRGDAKAGHGREHAFRFALNATDNQLVVEGTANAFSEVVRVQTIPAARWTAAGVKFGKPNNICQSGGKATRRSVFESLCYWRNVKK